MSILSNITGKKIEKSLLAESRIWEKQTQFYQYHGISSWDKKVPYQITNSTYIAKSYAKIILSYVLDSIHQGYDKPFIIIELGAAQGKFAYFLLTTLIADLKKHGLSTSKINYLLCDCSQKIIDFWNDHPQLQDFIQQDIIKTHKFYIDYKQGISFSGDTKNLQDKKVILIGNYFYDSLFQSAFFKEGNNIYPASIELPYDNNNKIDTNYIKFKKETKTIDNFYSNNTLNGILFEHKSFDAPRFLLPDAAFTILDYFSLHSQQVLFLSSDKSFTHHSKYNYCESFNFYNDGALSTTVNFYALKRYGQLQHNSFCMNSENLNIDDNIFFSTLMMLTQAKEQNYPLLNIACHQYICSFSATDLHISLHMLQSSNFRSTQDLISCIKLSNYDPNFIYSIHITAEKIILNSSVTHKEKMKKPLEKLLANFYYLPSSIESNFLYALARIAIACSFYDVSKEIISKYKYLYGMNYQYNMLMGSYYFHHENLIASKEHYSLAYESNKDCKESSSYIQICQESLNVSS